MTSPNHVIENPLSGWGAEYWLLRQQHGDPSYLEAFTRILNRAGDDGC
jgi:hypothetical protein